MQKPLKMGKYALWEEDPENPGQGRLAAEALGMQLTVYDAGTFVDEEGNSVEYPAGIKIKVGPKNFCKVTALQAQMVRKFIGDDAVQKIIRERAQEEKEIYLKNIAEAME